MRLGRRDVIWHGSGTPVSPMHANVERLIGRLLTDPELLRRFAKQPIAALVSQGLELSAVEIAALAAIDPAALRAIATALDPRLKRAPRAAGGPPVEGAEDTHYRGMAAEERKR